MAIHAHLFDREKAIEATLFMAKLLPNPTKHSISKMFYLADKLHLQEYGRLICGDRYIAMEYGPVPSAIYDMMKVAAGQGRIDPDTHLPFPRVEVSFPSVNLKLPFCLNLKWSVSKK